MNTDRHIARQITGTTVVKVYCKDTTAEPLFIELIAQEGKYWLRAAFAKGSPQITEDEYNELRSWFTDEQEFNTDPEVIRTELTEKEFLDKYYEKKRPHAGRPPLPGDQKKAGVYIKLPPALIIWMDDQEESRATLIEKACRAYYKIRPAG